MPEPEADGGVPALLDYVFASSKMEGEIVGKAFVLAEGDAKNRDDIIFLEPLPLFFN